MAKQIKTCKACKVKFYGNQSRSYCSERCKNDHSIYTRREKICLVCGKTFKASSAAKYCSQKCKYEMSRRSHSIKKREKEKQEELEKRRLEMRRNGLSYAQMQIAETKAMYAKVEVRK